MRASIWLCLLLAILGAWGNTASAAYPDRAIRIVVPFPPGGPVDLMARIVAPKLGERLGQKVDIDHVAGDDGIIGSDLVAKAAPDGYTLLLASSTHAIHPGTYGKLPFDTEKAFAPISLLVAAPLILVSSPALPVDSVEELIAYARSHPGMLRYASGGPGGPTQLAFELFKITTGVDIMHVPFDGGAAALKAVARDKAQVMLAPIIAALPMIHDGWVRGLAVSGANRAPVAPELPTIAELGYPDFETSQWYGVLVPAGTPREIVLKLNAEINKALQSSLVTQRYAADNAVAEIGSPEQFAGFIATEQARWRDVVRKADIKIE